VILEPNRQRRRRLFRAVIGLAGVLLVGTLLASGWTLPAFSIAGATASPPPSAAPTAAVAVVPSATPEATLPPPTPEPTPGTDGCTPAAADVKPATVVSHGPRTDKVVALTFDDGNDAPSVEKILWILRSRKVNATFFPTARAVELSPKTWQHVAQAGYPMANHTYHHDSLAGECYAKQLAELDKAKSVFAAATLPLQGLMRPPYEAFDMNTRLAASSAGDTHIVLWDVDTMDWTGVGRATVVARALVATSGSIVLMHTQAPGTPSALYEIIKKFRARGFRFVTVGQMLGVPGPAPF
jgi:peptidoglycan/xylan/chitin deacetylase (PgdA/CDA1 family)